MFIIFGTRSGRKSYGTGLGPVCPKCGTEVAHFVEFRRRGHIFFIPTVPMGHSFALVCAGCGNQACVDEAYFYEALSIAAANPYFQPPDGVDPGAYFPPPEAYPLPDAYALPPGAYPSPDAAGAYPSFGAYPAPDPCAYVQPSDSGSHVLPPPFAVAAQSSSPAFRPPPESAATAFYDRQVRQKVETVVQETKKKYRRDGFTRDREIAFIDNVFKVCPFCGGISNWSADNSDGFKFRLRCDSCLGEFYGVPHIKKPEKNHWKVNNVGYFNKSSLTAFQFYSLEEIAKLAAPVQGGEEA